MRRLALCLLPLALLLSSGCIRMHMQTDITADGSGTCSIEYGVSREVADALARLEAMDGGGMGGGEEMPDLGDLDREQVEQACKEAGVELKSFETTDDDAGESTRMVVAFEDVADLSDFLAATTDDEEEETREELRIERQEDGNYALTTVSVPVPESKQKAAEDEMGGEEDWSGEGDRTMDQGMDDMQESMELMGVLMGKLSELDIRMTVTVPGEVISSNAMEVEGRTSIWTINSANMMEAEGMEMEPHIVFEGKGLKLKPASR